MTINLMSQRERASMRTTLVIALCIIATMFGCADIIPTATPEQERGDGGIAYMESMPCDEVLRYDEVALNDLDDVYNEYLNAALILSRLSGEDIGYTAVKNRVDECASETVGRDYLLTQPCEDVLEWYAIAQLAAQDMATTQEQLRGLAYIAVGAEYSAQTNYDPIVLTRDAIGRIAQCEGR